MTVTYKYVTLLFRIEDTSRDAWNTWQDALILVLLIDKQVRKKILSRTLCLRAETSAELL
jgi:hypothetical protein